MNDKLIPRGFDYSQLPINIANQLMEIKLDIEKIRQEAIFEIGLRLIKAKKILDHGQFQNWIETEFNFSTRYARWLMSIAKVYGANSNRKHVSVLSFRALKSLSSSSTPEIVRQQVDELIDQGEKITESKVRALKQQYTIETDNENEQLQEQLDQVEPETDDLAKAMEKIQELYETIDRNQKSFKETLEEISQDNQNTLGQLNEQIEGLNVENRGLREQLEQLGDQNHIGFDEDFDSSGNDESIDLLKRQIETRDVEIGNLSNELRGLQEKYANQQMEEIKKLKDRYELKNEMLEHTIGLMQGELDKWRNGKNIEIKTESVVEDDDLLKFDSLDIILAELTKIEMEMDDNGFEMERVSQLRDRLSEVLERVDGMLKPFEGD